MILEDQNIRPTVNSDALLTNQFSRMLELFNVKYFNAFL